VRLGGIYALEGVMNTSEQYHQPVLEALCAFVRDATRDETKIGNHRPAIDVQATLKVIGRRRLSEIDAVDLVDVHIPSADLTGANLRGAWLNDANLSRAFLFSANLSGAFLNGTNLTNAVLDGANLSGANLNGANLSEAAISQDQLNQACGAEATLPPGLSLKPCASTN
jgi:uncharacterized protein YjbI with pentapeptide repeats